MMSVHVLFEEDRERCRQALARDTGPEETAEIIDVLMAWARYWARHEPNLEIRAIWQTLEVAADERLNLLQRSLH